MDAKLLAWGRAVKSRRRTSLPTLWLFTDPVRTPDPLAAIRALPAGLCGVVFRHDDVPGRAALGRAMARLCRARRVPMVSAGPPVPGAGLHLRGGHPRPWPFRGLRTASAHGPAELRRARIAGATVVFLSPAFPTRSHPGAASLGPVRWSAVARGAGTVLALGGIEGRSARRLPRWAAGAGAIGALTPA